MSDKPTQDQPVEGEVNKQAPNGNDAKRPGSEKASDREGQMREPGYDEA